MPKTAHLQPQLITFLKQLKKNNNREWFQKNKDRYELRSVPGLFAGRWVPCPRQLAKNLTPDGARNRPKH